VDLEGAVVIGIDCLGTYTVADYQGVGDKEALLDELLAQAVKGEFQASEGLEFRPACVMCEQPIPEGEHVALSIGLGLVGVEGGQLYLKARDDLAGVLGLEAGEVPLEREGVVGSLVAAREEARDGAFADFHRRTDSPEGLLREFSACIRCHNCMINCPICYCKECIVRTPFPPDAPESHGDELRGLWDVHAGVSSGHSGGHDISGRGSAGAGDI